MNSLGQISRTLSTYPILADEAPIFDLCMQGDILGLQDVLSSGTVSPFVLDNNGWSLPHVSSLPANTTHESLTHWKLARGVWITCRCVRFIAPTRR